MTSNDVTDEAGSVVTADQTLAKPTSHDSIFDKAFRTPEEHELLNPVAVQFMINTIRRLEKELGELRNYREDYFKVSSDLRVEKERSSLSNTAKNVSTLILSASCAGAGIVASLMEFSNASVALFITFTAIAIGSFFLKVKEKVDA